jgi:UDPglucose 6-dehydrogenase
MDVNESQRKGFFTKIVRKYNGSLASKTVAIWGLAFKPNTDDIREAPALYLIHKLLEAGAKVRVYDPEAMPNTQAEIGDKIHYATDQYDAVNGADMLIIATEWNAFRSPDFDRVRELMNAHVIYDGRNLYQTAAMRDLGFYYYSVGRKTVTQE